VKTAVLALTLLATTIVCASGVAEAGNFTGAATNLNGLKLKAAPSPTTPSHHLTCQVVPSSTIQVLLGYVQLPGAYLVTDNAGITIPVGTTYTIKAFGQTQTFQSNKTVSSGGQIAWQVLQITSGTCDAAVPL
jgi:hypothetical protein